VPAPRLQILVISLAAQGASACCAEHDGPAPCDSHQTTPRERFLDPAIAPVGSGYTIAFTDTPYDPDVDLPSTLPIVAMDDRGAPALGDLQAAGIELEGNLAGIAGDANGALAAWIDRDNMLYAAPLALPLTQPPETAGPAVLIGQVPTSATLKNVVASRDGYLVAWEVVDATMLQRLTRGGALAGDPFELPNWPLVAVADDAYLLVWNRPTADGRSEPVASRYPAAAGPPSTTVLAPPAVRAWALAATRSSTGYRAIVVGDTTADEIDNYTAWDVFLDPAGAILSSTSAPYGTGAFADVSRVIYDGSDYLYVRVAHPSPTQGVWSVEVVGEDGTSLVEPAALSWDDAPIELWLASRAPGDYAAVYRTTTADPYNYRLGAVRILRQGQTLTLHAYPLAQDWYGTPP